MSQADGHAAAPTHTAEPPKMDLPQGGQSLQDEPQSVRPTDRGTVASKGAGSQRHQNKQNINYALRTGLAGGLAGCAVWVQAHAMSYTKNYRQKR